MRQPRRPLLRIGRPGRRDQTDRMPRLAFTTVWRACACACLLALAGCTIEFTPGDAKPGTFTPYPSGAASGGSPASPDGGRGGPAAAY